MLKTIEPGTLIDGKYRVESVIGEGGMGVVVRARHQVLDELVAIKLLRPEMMEKEEVVQRFLREARSSVKLKGQHVARVVDVGTLPDGVPFIVMEYLEGADLGAILRSYGPQQPAVAVDLLLQACLGIAEAHSLGIVHRDIKAGNFFVTQPANQGPTLKVLDFGIATAPQGTSDLTSTQSVMGTPAYMAPEQMRASRLVDARSDIWSMGVVLYELLEGARPFRTDVYSELVIRVAMEPPVPMAQPVPDGLKAIVFRCLEKDVTRRYQNVAELAFDLAQFASDPAHGRAYADQCARVLGLLGSTASSPRLTPPPYNTPSSPRLTGSQPRLMSSSDAMLREPTPLPTPLPHSLTPAPGVLTQTPTSVSSSVGQMLPSSAAPATSKSRLGVVVGSAVAVAAIGVAIVVMVTRGSSTDNATQPATQPSGQTDTASQPAPAPAPTQPAQPTQPPTPTQPEVAQPASPQTPPQPTPTPTQPEVAQPAKPIEPAATKKKKVVVAKKPASATPGKGSGGEPAKPPADGDDGLYIRRQ